jgi:plastocyanin domain-containing protein
MNKSIIISLIVATALIGGALMLTKNKSNGTNESVADVNNVSVVDGKQIIEIAAKGGYHPAHSIAKAGLPTILRFNTNGTFDCSATVRIPSMNISQSLPLSGTTDVALGTQQTGVIHGTCGMGMYPFDVQFE